SPDKSICRSITSSPREATEQTQMDWIEILPGSIIEGNTLHKNETFESKLLWTEEMHNDFGNNSLDLIPYPNMNAKKYIQQDNIDLEDVQIIRENVGHGKTAVVHKAIYKEQVTVALKEYRFGQLTDQIMKDFHRELRVLKQLRHPNIALLLGSHIDMEAKELFLLLEWLPGGCLFNVLADKEFEISYLDVLTMALDVARGMEYLHAQNIVHRDLKSHKLSHFFFSFVYFVYLCFFFKYKNTTSLLLDEEYRVKVSDFGTAKHVDKLTLAMTEIGTLGYMAPEVIEPPKPHGYDTKVDVFSYGVLLWEMFCRGKVDNTLKGLGFVNYVKQLKEGIRPYIPSDCPDEFRKLINACWQFEPTHRPTFALIVKYLQYIIHSHREEFEKEYGSDSFDPDSNESEDSQT
ncbi:Protein kinase domain containing protein, partial [Reticulomyxa filosa]